MVLEVFVDGRPGYDPPHKKVGDRVRKGEPMFRIDDRDLKAELKIREASHRAAVAQLHRLEQMPRAEDLPTAIAAVDEARAPALRLRGGLQSRSQPLPEENAIRVRL